MKEPMFERRHMKKIAAVISEVGRFYGREARWRAVRDEMAVMLANDNPRFDRGRFDEACEP